MGAALLDAGVYEGIEADRHVTGQAAAVVVLSSVAAGVGAGGIYGPGLRTLVVFTLIALLTWMAWAMLVFQIGSRVLPERETSTDLGQVMRTVGFAAAPGMVQALAVIPDFARTAFVIAWAWMLVAMVIAVKHALDYRSTARAVSVCFLAAGLSLAVAIGVGVMIGPTLF
jgi:hypothetical protein